MAFLPLLLGIFTGSFFPVSWIGTHQGHPVGLQAPPGLRTGIFSDTSGPLVMATGLGMPLPHLLPHLPLGSQEVPPVSSGVSPP